MKPKKKLPKGFRWSVESRSYEWWTPRPGGRHSWQPVDKAFMEFMAETEADQEREAKGQQEFNF